MKNTDLGELAQKRLALRRGSPCGTVGRLTRGLNRAFIQRVGDLTDTGAGRASLKAAGIHRAGEVPTCGGCAVGAVVYDGVTAGPVFVSSEGNSAPDFGVMEIPVGSLSCANYQITVTADMQFAGLGGGFASAFINSTGLGHAPPRNFLTGAINTGLGANELTGIYTTKTFVVFQSVPPHPAFANFAGPLTGPQSVYIWPNVVFPDFTEGAYNIKNVHVVITVAA